MLLPLRRLRLRLRLLRLLTLLVVLPPAAELLLPSLAPPPPPPLPLDFRCRRLDLLDDPPYRVRSAALVGAWEVEAPAPAAVDDAATAAATAAEGAFAVAAAAPLRMKGFFAARRATPPRRFLFPFSFSLAAPAPSHSPTTSSLADPLSEPALVDELPEDTLSPPSLSLRNTVRSAVADGTAIAADVAAAAVCATLRPRDERPPWLVCAAGSGGGLGRARFLALPPPPRVARGDAFDGEFAAATTGAHLTAGDGDGDGVGDDAAGGGVGVEVIALAAAAAPIAAISAPVEPQVGKSGLFSAGTVLYWKSSASLVKNLSSPVSGSSGKGSSSCSPREFQRAEEKRKGGSGGWR